MGKATQPQNGFTALKTDDSQEQQGVESMLHEVSSRRPNGHSSGSSSLLPIPGAPGPPLVSLQGLAVTSATQQLPGLLGQPSFLQDSAPASPGKQPAVYSGNCNDHHHHHHHHHHHYHHHSNALAHLPPKLPAPPAAAGLQQGSATAQGKASTSEGQCNQQAKRQKRKAEDGSLFHLPSPAAEDQAARDGSPHNHTGSLLLQQQPQQGRRRLTAVRSQRGDDSKNWCQASITVPRCQLHSACNALGAGFIDCVAQPQ